jgi:excinuclease UvrABC nuclease subunit
MFDSAGHLLYIGKSVNIPSRVTDHSLRKFWWGDVSDIKLTHYGTHEELLGAEVAAIRSEHPRYNIVHNCAAPLDPQSAPL